MLGGSGRLFCGRVALVTSFVLEGLHGAWIAFWCVASHMFPARVGVVCAMFMRCMGGQERVEFSIIIHVQGVLH